MRAQKDKPMPKFVSLRDFCSSIGIYHALAIKLIGLGVLHLDTVAQPMPRLRFTNCARKTHSKK
jgi:hypothetical protein